MKKLLDKRKAQQSKAPHVSMKDRELQKLKDLYTTFLETDAGFRNSDRQTHAAAVANLLVTSEETIRMADGSDIRVSGIVQRALDHGRKCMELNGGRTLDAAAVYKFGIHTYFTTWPKVLEVARNAFVAGEMKAVPMRPLTSDTQQTNQRLVTMHVRFMTQPLRRPNPGPPAAVSRSPLPAPPAPPPPGLQGEAAAAQRQKRPNSAAAKLLPREPTVPDAPYFPSSSSSRPYTLPAPRALCRAGGDGGATAEERQKEKRPAAPRALPAPVVSERQIFSETVGRQKFYDNPIINTVQMPNPMPYTIQQLWDSVQSGGLMYANTGDAGTVPFGVATWGAPDDSMRKWKEFTCTLLSLNTARQDKMLHLVPISAGTYNVVWAATKETSYDVTTRNWPTMFHGKFEDLVIRIPRREEETLRDPHKQLSDHQLMKACVQELHNVMEAAYGGYGPSILCAWISVGTAPVFTGSGVRMSEPKLIVVQQKMSTSLNDFVLNPISIRMMPVVANVVGMLKDVIFEYSVRRKMHFDGNLRNFMMTSAGRGDSLFRGINGMYAIDLDPVFFWDIPLASTEEKNEGWKCLYLWNMLFVTTMLRMFAPSEIFAAWKTHNMGVSSVASSSSDQSIRVTISENLTFIVNNEASTARSSPVKKMGCEWVLAACWTMHPSDPIGKWQPPASSNPGDLIKGMREVLQHWFIQWPLNEAKTLLLVIFGRVNYPFESETKRMDALQRFNGWYRGHVYNIVRTFVNASKQSDIDCARGKKVVSLLRDLMNADLANGRIPYPNVAPTPFSRCPDALQSINQYPAFAPGRTDAVRKMLGVDDVYAVAGVDLENWF